MVEKIEFIDCGTLNISYDATGKANVSFTIVKNDSNVIEGIYTNKTWGKVTFDLVVMGASQQPMIGSGGWCQWQMQLEGVGNK